MQNFSLEQLATFVRVVEAGSFSAAASALDVSQPAVSQQIRELERRLGAKLLERVGRKIGPTAAGATLLGYARMILETAALAAEAIGRHVEGIQGTVRIGTGATACLHLLPAVLAGVQRQYPALQVIVSTGNTEDFVKRVEQNLLDMALVTLPVSSRALHVTPAFEDSFVLIGPPMEKRLPKALSAQDLKELPMMLFEPGANTRRLVDGWLLNGGVRLQPKMELGSVEAIKEMVMAGLGYSIIPGMALRDADVGAVQVRQLLPPLKRELGLIVRQDKPVTRGMKVIAEALLSSVVRADT
jgi:DNA-binding transcriptional LysR family regulator